MLNVVNKSIMLIVIMLNVVMLSVMASDRSQFGVKMTESRLIITGPGLAPIFVER